MALDLSPDLIAARQHADFLRARVEELSQRHGRPTEGEGWSAEQHAAWQAAWLEWRQAVGAVQDAITEAAATLGEPRWAVETALRAAAGRPETPDA
ncbi:hypothetical protein AB0N23_03655 [Streptomyces sp. NPDC052644]